MVPHSSDPALIASDEYSMLCGFYDAVEALLDAPDSILFDTHETISNWSPAQHLYHILVAGEKSLKAAQLTARGEGPVQYDGHPNATGAQILRNGSLGDLKAEAPASVRPPAFVTREALREAYRSSRAELNALADDMPTLSDSKARLPHPAFGPLRASEWLRFARIHADHHQDIVQEILNAARSQASKSVQPA